MAECWVCKVSTLYIAWTKSSSMTTSSGRAARHLHRRSTTTRIGNALDCDRGRRSSLVDVGTATSVGWTFCQSGRADADDRQADDEGHQEPSRRVATPSKRCRSRADDTFHTPSTRCSSPRTLWVATTSFTTAPRIRR